MSARPEILLAIALCALVTVIPRVLPMLLAHRIEPPAWVVVWLRLVPAAILAALLVPELLLADGGELKAAGDIVNGMVASAVTVAVFVASGRNFMVAFISGVAIYAVLINFVA